MHASIIRIGSQRQSRLGSYKETFRAARTASGLCQVHQYCHLGLGSPRIQYKGQVVVALPILPAAIIYVVDQVVVALPILLAALIDARATQNVICPHVTLDI